MKRSPMITITSRIVSPRGGLDEGFSPGEMKFTILRFMRNERAPALRRTSSSFISLPQAFLMISVIAEGLPVGPSLKASSSPESTDVVSPDGGSSDWRGIPSIVRVILPPIMKGISGLPVRP